MSPDCRPIRYNQRTTPVQLETKRRRCLHTRSGGGRKRKKRKEEKKYSGKREEEEEEEDWFSNEVSIQKVDFSIERLIFERNEQPRRKNHDNRGNIIREKMSARMIGRHWTIMNR